MPFGIGHPHLHIKWQSTFVWEGSRVPNLQTEFNYLNLFKSYGIFSDFVVPVVPMLSPWSPRRPHHLHVVPVSSLLSPHHPHSPQKVPMWSPWLWSPPHVVPVVPWSPRGPHHPHVIHTSSRRSPHHSQSLRYPLYPPLTPLGGGPRISNNAIRFELIKIF